MGYCSQTQPEGAVGSDKVVDEEIVANLIVAMGRLTPRHNKLGVKSQDANEHCRVQQFISMLLKCSR